MSKDWIKNFIPEVVEDTGHYVRIKAPSHPVGQLEMAEFCEHLFSLGYRYLSGYGNNIVCEKI